MASSAQIFQDALYQRMKEADAKAQVHFEIRNMWKLYLKNDVVAIGVDGSWEAVVKRVKEVGRYFLLYEIWEVGIIPIGCVQTTQLVVTLISHPLAFLCFLAVIIMVIFPCFFQSSTVFWKLSEVLKKEDKLQSCFSDSALIVLDIK
jgi:hypothetical protein